MIESLLKYAKKYPSHPEIQIIKKSLSNIKNNPHPFTTKEQCVLYKKEITNIFKSIEIYTRSMLQTSNKQCQKIEQQLFNIAFNPGDNYETKILPIYLLHDDFIQANESICSLKSSTGSGKTRCAPFFFAIKAIQTNMKQPFFIMTQPSSTIIKDKIQDFNTILDDSVILIGNDYLQFIKYYQQFREDKEKFPKKPIVALFTPHYLARLISKNKNIHKYARFALDEIHERSVETDVIAALLAERLFNSKTKLHLLMMTATPDPRIIELFNNSNFKQFDLEDSLLFPIVDIKKEVSNFNILDEEAKNGAIDIISKMENGQINPGHILIFTSGNRRINRITDLINKDIKKLPNRIKLLRYSPKTLKNEKLFYSNLDDQIGDDNESLFVLILKYAGFLSPVERDIGKNPIPNHQNVVKIIIATNAIESSITIDGLAAVIDCGIFNQPILDKARGIQKLEESPISIQSQTQRRGRVGRKREGICVQLTVKNHPPVNLISPAIEKEDISSNILSLRKIGIQLEKIKNLPKPGVPANVMCGYLNELKELGALDEEANLTEKGNRIGSFVSLLPFVSTSIMEVSQKCGKYGEIAQIAGSLVFQIFSTKDLYIDTLTEGFRRNFNPDSDVITLLNSILEVMTKSGKIKFNLEQFGFHSGNALRVIGNVEQTAANIYQYKKKLSWESISNFCHRFDMMQFVSLIAYQIEVHKRQWTSCRRAKYFTVSNLLNDYNFIYHGDASLDEESDSEPEVILNKRPGAIGLATPGTCFIFQISKSNNNKYYGSMVHRDIMKPETCHPLSTKAPITMKNQFTVPLIEAYLGEDAKLFRPFQKTKTYQETKHGGILCFPERLNDNYSILSYAPENVSDKEAIQKMETAFNKISKLMQFTPNTILIRNDSIKALVAITGVGFQKLNSKVILYTDKNPIPYQIDRNTIDYLLTRINELKDVDGHLTIAMTGEKFYYSNEDEDFLGTPITWQTAKCVFGTTSLFYSHMVIISDKEIPNGQRLTWVDPSISITYTDVDALIHIANTIYRGVVSVSHNYEFLYAMNKDAKVFVDGKIPHFHGTTQHSNVFRPIGCMFDRYAMQCIKNESLISDVKLKSFSLTGKINEENLKIDLKRAINMKKRFGKNCDLKSIVDLVPPRARQISIRINQLVERRKEISKLWNTDSSNKSKRISMINAQKEINAELNSLNGLLNQFLIQSGMNKKDFYNLVNIRTPSEILSIDHLYVFDDRLEASVRSDDAEATINTLMSYRRDLGFEILPKCDLVIHHRNNSRLNKIDFIEKINEVCRRFGRVVEKKFDYIDFRNNSFDKGIIKVTLFGGDFVIPFVGEVKKSIGFGDKIPLKVPQSIVPFCIRFRPNVITAISEWIREYRLNLYQRGPIFIGSTVEVERAMDFLKNKDSQPNIPYKSYTIPGDISIAHVVSLVNKKNRSLSLNQKWGVDKQSQCQFLVFPDDVKVETVDAFIKGIRKKTHQHIVDDDDILFDYCGCCGKEEAVLSGSQIPLFNKDGSFVCRNFCVSCAYDLFLHAVNNDTFKLYDQEEAQPRLEHLLGNSSRVPNISPLNTTSSSCWPSIPLGQYLWCLISEPKLNSVARTWFSAVYYQSLHSAFEFCPDHPTFLLRRKKDGTLRCPQIGCGMHLCIDCKKWHKKGECKQCLQLPMGFRICPSCKTPIEKTQDCNHIACSCGKHFCYYCGWGPQDDSKAVYHHMGREHGGCFNDPPDYMRMRGSSVSNEELQAFYQKYPHLNPNKPKSTSRRTAHKLN